MKSMQDFTNLNKEHTLWVEKYRPQKPDEYIGNDHMVEKVNGWVSENDIPHLLLYGIQGTGKTSLAKILVGNLNCEFLYINASSENGVDVIRTRINRFASTISMKELKIVILDEADYMTPNGQAALKHAMELFSKRVRFILTCNQEERIIEPIRSRCQCYNIVPPSRAQVAMRVAHVLQQESVAYENESLKIIIDAKYPDIRACINEAQSKSTGGKLMVDTDSVIKDNYMLEILEVFKEHGTAKSAFVKIRQIIANSQVKRFEDLYRFFYDKVEDYAEEGFMGAVILILADGQYKESFVVDKEINIMATIQKILEVIK